MSEEEGPPVAQRKLLTLHRPCHFGNDDPGAKAKQRSSEEEDGGRPPGHPSNEGGGRGAPLVTIGFDLVVLVTVMLPLSGIIVCFVTAIVFQSESVTKTFCNVSNTIPSISAITGFSPQRYFWRTCIALHSMPRFVIGIVYWYYYQQRECFIQAANLLVYRRVVKLTISMYVTENVSLIGITYISSIENYPVHEKLFITFMISSLLYGLLTILLFRWCHPVMSTNVTRSYNLKQFCFYSIILLTAAMSYFFYLHRFHCIPGAFTKFACCEYIIVILNITYHYTAAYDFAECGWLFVSRPRLKTDANDNHKAQ